MEKDEFIDVNFTENENFNNIKGKPLYYSTSQVASILDLTDSSVRYYCSKFKDMLNIQMTGTHRKFTEEDIEKLKYIKKLLKEDGFSINQVQEYASEKDISVIENKVNKQEPMAMQFLATALSIEIGSQLEDFKLMLSNELESNKNEIKEMVAEVINNKLDTKLTEMKSFIDIHELEAKNRDVEMINLMKSNMEKRQENKKDGFLKKIFGK